MWGDSGNHCTTPGLLIKIFCKGHCDWRQMHHLCVTCTVRSSLCWLYNPARLSIHDLTQNSEFLSFFCWPFQHKLYCTKPQFPLKKWFYCTKAWENVWVGSSTSGEGATHPSHSQSVHGCSPSSGWTPATFSATVLASSALHLTVSSSKQRVTQGVNVICEDLLVVVEWLRAFWFRGHD